MTQDTRRLLAMSWLTTLSRISVVMFLSFLLTATAWCSDKKGIGLADLHAPERIEALNVAWYYTWKHLPIEGAPEEKFVPMLRSRGGRVLQEQISYFRGKGKVPLLLALNEPNKRKGDNMSVEKVIRKWPEISELADVISSPAPAGVLSSWFSKFYHIANKRGLKYDFMAIHCYSPPNPKGFLKKIDAVYEKYGMPIWITEFAVADWSAKEKPGTNQYSEKEVLVFMQAVLPELEKRPFIIRYAWFGAGKVSLKKEQLRTSRLLEKDGSLTPLGEYYSKFTWPQE